MGLPPPSVPVQQQSILLAVHEYLRRLDTDARHRQTIPPLPVQMSAVHLSRWNWDSEAYLFA